MGSKKMDLNYTSKNVTVVKICNQKAEILVEDYTNGFTEKCSENSEIEPLINTKEFTDDNLSENSNKTTVLDKSLNKYFSIYLKKYRKSIIGAQISVLSTALFTLNNILFKKFNLDISDVLLVRNLLQIGVLLAILCSTGNKLLPRTGQEQYLMMCRGLVGAIGLISTLASLNFIGLPDALFILSFQHMFTLLFTKIFKGDTLTSIKCFSSTLLLFGVILVTQPSCIFHCSSWAPFLRLVPQPGMYGEGIALAALGSIAWSVMAVAIAKSETVPTLVYSTWTTIFTLPVAIILNLLQPGSLILSPFISNISPTHWCLFLVISLSGCVGFLLWIESLQFLSPTTLSSLTGLEGVLSYTAQLVLSSQYPDSWAGGGLVLLLTSLAIIAFHDAIARVSKVREAALYEEMEGAYRDHPLHDENRQ